MRAGALICRALVAAAACGHCVTAFAPPPARPIVHAWRVAPHPRPVAAAVMQAGGAVEVTVRRGADGLGIEVDSDNVVLGSSGQPDLSVGDVITAVNGEPLSGRYLARAIDPEASEYTFTVDRTPGTCARALEGALLFLGTDLETPSVGEMDAEAQARVADVVAALERLSPSVAPADARAAQLGMWKLMLSTGPEAHAGLSGAGEPAPCTLIAHWQNLGEGDPNAQVVEVIADQDLGRHAVAVLKGSAEYQPGSDAPPAVGCVAERYGRLELGGSVVSTNTVSVDRACTYVSEQLRIVRPLGAADERGQRAFSCYWRTTAEDAQLEIGRLAEARPGGSAAPAAEDVPRWARSRDDYEYETDAGGSSIP